MHFYLPFLGLLVFLPFFALLVFLDFVCRINSEIEAGVESCILAMSFLSNPKETKKVARCASVLSFNEVLFRHKYDRERATTAIQLLSF